MIIVKHAAEKSEEKLEYMIGDCYEHLNQYKKAIKHYKKHAKYSVDTLKQSEINTKRQKL